MLIISGHILRLSVNLISLYYSSLEFSGILHVPGQVATMLCLAVTGAYQWQRQRNDTMWAPLKCVALLCNPINCSYCGSRTHRHLEFTSHTVTRQLRMYPLERQVSYFFKATLPLKPATIALKIGHKRLSRPLKV